MTEPPQTPPPPDDKPKPPQGQGGHSLAMALFGVLMVFPGICSLTMTSAVFHGGGVSVALWVLGLVIGATGMLMIVTAYR